MTMVRDIFGNVLAAGDVVAIYFSGQRGHLTRAVVIETVGVRARVKPEKDARLRLVKGTSCAKRAAF